MKLWVCIDGLSQWLLCAIVGGDSTKPFALNPAWDPASDILSIPFNYDPTKWKWDDPQYHRSGTSQPGPDELFSLLGDFVFVSPVVGTPPNPNFAPQSRGFRVITLT